MPTPLRILLVEDSETDAALLIAELKRHDYDITYTRVDVAEDMRTALEENTWDVVISDYSMPTFNAMAALETLHTANLDLPFIIVSGTVDEEAAVTALRAGAHDFLTKSRLARLVPAIERERREAKARHERGRLEEELRQSQKLEGIGRLAGGIAHDFNNILTTIAGYSEMVLDQIGRDKPISADLLEIRKATDRAAQLTRQLLAFSRQQVLRVVDVDVNEVIDAMRGMLQRLIGEDIVIDANLAADLRPIRADRIQLEQVLMNVAGNARDAMPHGGRFVIETGPAAADDVTERVGVLAAPGPYVMLAMSDTGTGMDDRTRQRIFEPFFTTKELGKGTGLGLATVYGIVNQLDGYIAASSELGQGSRFTLFFPAQEARERPVAAPARPNIQELPLASQHETVLVVEDEPGVRHLITRTLERHGYLVLAAASASDGLAHVESSGSTINLVLTDVVMAGMNGPDMVKHIRQTRPAVRVLYMSGHAGHAIRQDGRLEVTDHFLEKPFYAHDLLKAVRDRLDAP